MAGDLRLRVLGSSLVSDLECISEQQRFQLLINSITDYAIYMLDLTGRIATWNPGAERFKGYTADEIIGQNFSVFFTPEDREAGLPAKAMSTALAERSRSASGSSFGGGTDASARSVSLMRPSRHACPGPRRRGA